jgi:hypothetical protein
MEMEYVDLFLEHKNKKMNKIKIFFTLFLSCLFSLSYSQTNQSTSINEAILRSDNNEKNLIKVELRRKSICEETLFVINGELQKVDNLSGCESLLYDKRNTSLQIINNSEEILKFTTKKSIKRVIKITRLIL